jgi:hypothetical protein
MLRSLVIFSLLSPIAISQVRVSTPGTDFKSHEQIDVRITNAGSSAVSYCVEFGQASYRAGTGTEGDVESTPIPFYVQKQNSGKWQTLLIGPDVGSSEAVDMPWY